MQIKENKWLNIKKTLFSKVTHELTLSSNNHSKSTLYVDDNVFATSNISPPLKTKG